MLRISSFLILFSLMAAIPVFCQIDQCDALPSSHEITFMDSQLPIPSIPLDAQFNSFPLSVHVIKSSLYSGNSISLSDLNSKLELVNQAFERAKINFTIISFKEYINDELYQNNSTDLIQRYQYPYFPNTINLYLVENIIPNYPNGYTSFPATSCGDCAHPDDRIFITYSAITNGTTFSHELGHFFGLYHTFEGSECKDACLGLDCGLDLETLYQKCEISGDRCCDTPIDPKLNINDDVNCIDDANCNNIAFPDIEYFNLMSYYQCRETFSNDQINRIYHFSKNGRQYISDNNQSQLLTLLSPSYGAFESFAPRDVHFFYGDSQIFPVNIEYRELGGAWKKIVEDSPVAIGYNIYKPTYTPLFYGSGSNQYEFKVQYSDNSLIYDVGEPITVNSINLNPNIDLNIELSIDCVNCYQGNTQLITWNSTVIPSPATVDLYYTSNGGITWNLISASAPNTGIVSWTIPKFDVCETINNVSIALQYKLGSEPIVFDVIDGFINIEQPEIDLNAGLIAYYPFNGNTNDESGNGYNGISYGATLTSDRFGDSNNSYHFNGINNFIEISNPYFEFNNQISVSAWFKFEAGSQVGSGIGQARKNVDDWNRNVWMIVLNAELNILSFFTVKDTGGGNSNNNRNQYNVQAPIEYDSWVHVVAVSSPDFTRLYFNGKLVDQDEGNPGPFISSSSNVIQFGKDTRYANGRWMKGKIDDVRIYNRPLNCNEISLLYNQGCIQYQVVSNQIFNADSTIYARQFIELNNVTINSPAHLTVKSPEVLIDNNCIIHEGTKLTIINEDGCINNK